MFQLYLKTIEVNTDPNPPLKEEVECAVEPPWRGFEGANDSSRKFTYGEVVKATWEPKIPAERALECLFDGSGPEESAVRYPPA